MCGGGSTRGAAPASVEPQAAMDGAVWAARGPPVMVAPGLGGVGPRGAHGTSTPWLPPWSSIRHRRLQAARRRKPPDLVKRARLCGPETTARHRLGGRSVSASVGRHGTAPSRLCPGLALQGVPRGGCPLARRASRRRRAGAAAFGLVRPTWEGPRARRRARDGVASVVVRVVVLAGWCLPSAGLAQVVSCLGAGAGLPVLMFFLRARRA